MTKTSLRKMKEPLKTLIKMMFLNQRLHITFKVYKYVKVALKHYEGALEDLNNTDFLEPITLKSCGDIKNMLKDY
jgi:hypothetical protein